MPLPATAARGRQFSQYRSRNTQPERWRDAIQLMSETRLMQAIKISGRLLQVMKRDIQCITLSKITQIQTELCCNGIYLDTFVKQFGLALQDQRLKALSELRFMLVL